MNPNSTNSLLEPQGAPNLEASPGRPSKSKEANAEHILCAISRREPLLTRGFSPKDLR